MTHLLEEGSSILDPPSFDCQNFSTWKIKFKAFICSSNFDLWDLIELGYEKPKFEFNGHSFELPYFQYDNEQVLNAKLDFEAKTIFYHVLDGETLNLISKFDSSNEI